VLTLTGERPAEEGEWEGVTITVNALISISNRGARRGHNNNIINTSISRGRIILWPPPRREPGDDCKQSRIINS
jgi:hypothetical protein